jgi:Rieske Fe-S protein
MLWNEEVRRAYHAPPTPSRNDQERDYVRVSAQKIPAPGGAPVLNKQVGFYLVNLTGEDKERNLLRGGEGLLALSTVCPHLGLADCPVRWSPDRIWSSPLGGTEVGVFKRRCHGSIFTKAGVRMFGPTPRSLDTLRTEEAGDDEVKVHFRRCTRRRRRWWRSGIQAAITVWR